MATFNVFVEGALDDSPTALPELAEAMSQRYGVAATELVNRLRRGRFRVKSNVDAGTAERLRRDLEAIGARVLVEDAALSPTATPPAGVPHAPAPSKGPAPQGPRPTPVSGAPVSGAPVSGAPGLAHRPSTPPPVLPAQPRASTPPPVSGLAAAFSQELPVQQDLGALSGDALSLASLDGEDAPAASNQFDAPPEPPPEPPKAAVSFKPKPSAAEPPKARPAPAKALDLFAPPDAGDQELKVDLATEEVEERARKKASAPPENAPVAPASPSILPGHRNTPMSLAVEGVAKQPAELSRTRFAGAVLLALVLGFIPVHFIGKMRENSAYSEIDARVAAAHASVESMETYLALDGARRTLLDEKKSKRQMIALTQMALWAALSTAIAFGLLRAQNRGEKSSPTPA